MSMARSERARSAGSRAEAGLLRSAFVRESGGLGLLGIAIFSAIALWSYAPGDPLWSADRVANLGGPAPGDSGAAVSGGDGAAAARGRAAALRGSFGRLAR